ncbi:MAG: type I restriction endonuclease subunit R [Phycisphaerales bacterium]|nr:type I restriction endonuclease subunit R [Phycisphaerales bacterium]
MGWHGSESEFEHTTIERLKALGYAHVHGSELLASRGGDEAEVVLKDRLRASLAARYGRSVARPDGLPDAAIDLAVARFSRPEGVDTLRRNAGLHAMLRGGVEIPVEEPGARGGPPTRRIAHVYAVDWERPECNDFLVVNQLPVHGSGGNDRRPDVVVYVNGLPLVLFELKNPYDEHPTAADAINQIGHYRHEIPQLFDHNALCIASDGVTTLHGMWTASAEWYAPWKSIDGVSVERGTTGTMKTLVEGLLPRDRLLAYVRDFIVFETVGAAGGKIIKKGAKYHQFFAVRIGARKILESVKAASTDKRLGVIWHTTGSGKSLSMCFLVGMLRREPALNNPTFVVQVDRTDLDQQLHDQFVAARSLVGEVKHARSVEDLRGLLQTRGGEVIFTTIEKFALREGEAEHPVLSTRDNIIVIADEAHRSQYGFTKGFARWLGAALPSARRLGFTGTPVSFSGADTVEVFGDLVHVYDIRQSQDDKATVPIFYEPRQIRLHLNKTDVDGVLAEIVEDAPIDELERKKGQWAALAKAAGAKDRIDQLAADLLAHFKDRTATLRGKAMVVCVIRENCVRLYDALRALPGCPEIKVVMTGDLGKDPEAWSKAGHLTTKQQREAIKKRMIDADDPLAMVIVCDMWLTGTDIPCLHTLYVDKPMKGHTMIQAISRVNRVFCDKPHGLIVDYIGIGDELRAATAKYSSGGEDHGKPAGGLDEDARPLFAAALAEVRSFLPEGVNYGDWRRLSPIALEDRYAAVYGHLTSDDDLRDRFLDAELRLTSAFLLVKHLDDCRASADEVIFCQRVRKQLLKTIRGRGPGHDVEKAVRDLVDDSVESEGVVDIFKAAGITRADISILDDNFLQTFKDRPLPDLRLRLLEKLLADEIHTRAKGNLAKAKTFRELLEATLQKYHNRLIDAAAVIRAMLEIKKDMEASDQRAARLGLAEDELAFYDAVAANYENVYGVDLLKGLVHEVVQSIKRNLRVDWTEPHREDVKAAVRAAVRRVLAKQGIKAEDFDRLLPVLMAQAEALYAEWPIAA